MSVCAFFFLGKKKKGKIKKKKTKQNKKVKSGSENRALSDSFEILEALWQEERDGGGCRSGVSF